MKRALVVLRGSSTYSQSRHFDDVMVPSLERESKDAYDQRTWRHHIHADPIGRLADEKDVEERERAEMNRRVFIPGMALKNCLTDGVKFLGEKVPEKRGATWTKHYNSGIMVIDNLYIFDPKKVPIKEEKGKKTFDWSKGAITIGDAQSERLYMNADGKKGGSSRVWRTYPIFHEWIGVLPFYILDQLIVRDVFVPHFEASGLFIGVGRFRPQKGGFYGRFEVVDCVWETVDDGQKVAAPADELEAA